MVRKTSLAMVKTMVFAAAAALMLIVSGCGDDSCDKEGDTKCDGADLEVCTDGEWERTDCLDSCNTSSATCTETDSGAHCDCYP